MVALINKLPGPEGLPLLGNSLQSSIVRFPCLHGVRHCERDSRVVDTSIPRNQRDMGMVLFRHGRMKFRQDHRYQRDMGGVVLSCPHTEFKRRKC
ncbi:hypothetical protein Pcinc_010696 [Petrolisthes cinctipes]|uniref:Uncharacterized protein n=1 Tax=Petrolisthes cinctipes TaxID=88211 RepID=A0AAE1G2I8_PETCI|nr:hypothetical protein Pcinc_010696 [Petrolisthes cinctipes]